MEYPNFNQLHYFWRIAREGGFTAASRRLYTSQSNLSVQIRQLENYFGETLFARGRRGVRPTASGELLLKYAERIFQPAEGLRDRLKVEAPPPSPVLHLGYSMGISSAILGEIHRFLLTRFPVLPLRVSSAPIENLRDLLLRHRVDLAVSSGDLAPGGEPDLGARWVARFPMHFVATHSLANKIRRFPMDLSRVPVLLRFPNHPTRKEVDFFLQRHGIALRSVVETESADSLTALILAGAGAGVVDALTFRSLKTSLQKLNRRPLPFHENLWFYHHRARPWDTGSERPRDVLLEKFRIPVLEGGRGAFGKTG